MCDQTTSTTDQIPAALSPEQRAAYPAELRVLDDAVDAAMRPTPAWESPKPELHPEFRPIDRTLKLPSGGAVYLHGYSDSDQWSANALATGRIEATTVAGAQAGVIRPLIVAVEAALADLRAIEAATESEVAS